MASLERARELAEAGELDKAWKVVDAVLQENVDDPKALILATFILEKAGRITVAYHLAKRLTELYPQQCVAWINLGRCADELWRIEESFQCYEKALALAKTPDLKCTANVNMSALLVQVGRFREVIKYAQAALEVNPENLKARHNLGVAFLAERRWHEGWTLYSASLGSPQRIMWKYGDEPTWKGEGGTVVVYGEQGIGDEINAASMVPDAIKAAGRVILDCDPRLANLYRRSFPAAKVYGTRTKSAVEWDPEDQKIDASISSMELGGLFRLKDEDFPGTPYLVADPERVAMWRSLFERKRKPVIGIAWSGGVPQSGAKFRKMALEDLMPVFKAISAHWVCLQYKDAEEEVAAVRKRGVDIVQYPYATLTNDYDDTAALVAACDRVLCMQTAVAHLAGALGKECQVFLPQNSQWRYGESGDQTLWYNSVRLIRQSRRGEWKGPILMAADLLQEKEAA